MNFELTVPRNTTEISPVINHYEPLVNKINNMVIRIPDGHKFLTRFQIRNRGRVLVPVQGSGSIWLRGNDQTVNIPSFPFPLEGPPYDIDLVGWSEDDTYSHTFYVDIN